MRQFLVSRAARQTAWLALVALTAGLGLPYAQGRAAAQTPARTAYLMPFTAAQGVDAEIPTRMSAELTTVLRKFRGDARVKQPIELLALSERNPVVARALADGAVTKEQIANPPTDKDAAVKFARQLGLTTVLVGTVDSFKEAADRTTASIDATVLEYYVPQQADAEATVVRTASKNTTIKAADEREKALLRTNITQRLSLMLASTLMDAPEIAPVEKTPEGTPAAKKAGGGGSMVWVLVGTIVGVAAIFLISTMGGSKKGGGTPSVTGVTASSEANSVRITWTAAAGAIGYNVYRKQSGTQPVRSHGRTRQTTATYTLLVNPETNTTPTVVGSGRTSFIDTTASNGVIYDYSVAAVSATGEVGTLSTSVTGQTQAGANIGSAPSLSASSGNGFVSLRWTTSSSFVNGYIIFRRLGGAPNTSTSSPDELARVANITSYDDKTVVNDATYYYIVQPYTTVNVNGLLAGADSNSVSVTPSATALPQAPRNVAATVDSTGKVVISWTANPETNIDYYEIMQRRDRASTRAAGTGRAPWLRNSGRLGPSGSPGVRRSDPRAQRQVDLSSYTLIATTPASTTSYSLTGLSNGTYTFAVRAVNKLQQRGDASASNSVTVNAPSAAPGNLTADSGDKTVALTWQAVQDVASYNLYRSQSPILSTMTNPATAPGITKIGTVGGTTLAYTDSTVSNNITFYYAITSVNSAGAESDFGKGSTANANTGVVAIPHAAPATMTMAVDNSKTNLSGNGTDTATLRVTVKDSSGATLGGVPVTLTTSAGTFTNLPAYATVVDTATNRQVRALTDLTGQVALALQSSVVTTATSVSVQAQSTKLPAGQQLASLTFAFQVSAPVVMVVTPDSSSLTADEASTTNITARVVDALGQPVPDGRYNVNFRMSSNNGTIRRAGDISLYPFPDTPPAAGVDVPVVGGQAVAVYRAGKDATTLNAANIITLSAQVKELPSVASQTIVSLVPGSATRVDFGVTTLSIPKSQTQTLTVTVKDAKGNAVRSGVIINFTVNPTGPFTVPASGTTDADGKIQLQITAGASAGGAVLIGTINGTQLQSQLTVTIQ